MAQQGSPLLLSYVLEMEANLMCYGLLYSSRLAEVSKIKETLNQGPVHGELERLRGFLCLEALCRRYNIWPFEHRDLPPIDLDSLRSIGECIKAAHEEVRAQLLLLKIVGTGLWRVSQITGGAIADPFSTAPSLEKRKKSLGKCMNICSRLRRSLTRQENLFHLGYVGKIYASCLATKAELESGLEMLLKASPYIYKDAKHG